MVTDVRISCGWDTDMTDIDLHVREPDGNECMCYFLFPFTCASCVCIVNKLLYVYARMVDV